MSTVKPKGTGDFHHSRAAHEPDSCAGISRFSNKTRLDFYLLGQSFGKRHMDLCSRKATFGSRFLVHARTLRRASFLSSRKKGRVERVLASFVYCPPTAHPGIRESAKSRRASRLLIRKFAAIRARPSIGQS
jgi:hypothetical protein